MMSQIRWDAPQFEPPRAGGDTLAPLEGILAPGEIFGPASQPALSIGHFPASDPLPLSGEPLFQSSVLLLALGYCLILLCCLSHARTIAGILRGRIYTESLLEEANHSLHVFLGLTTVLGLPATAIAIVRVGEWVDGELLAALLPLRAVAVPLVVAAVVAVRIYRRLLLGIAGSVTLHGAFVHKLNYLRRMVGALTLLFATPVLLLCALDTGPAQGVTIPLLIALIAAGVGVLLHKTRQLFATAGVSILHWISYLCAVEIFPITLIAGIVIHNG